MTCGELSIL